MFGSLKNQSYKNIEINIIYGFSTDKTIEIAKKYSVKKIKKIKGFLLQTRYEGVKLAKGKYVLLLDSDQILSKDTIEMAVKKWRRKVDPYHFHFITIKMRKPKKTSS